MKSALKLRSLMVHPDPHTQALTLFYVFPTFAAQGSSCLENQ